MRPTITRSLLLMLSILYGRASSRMENFGFWLEDRCIHDGRAGHVTFNCDEDDADGVVRCRSVDTYGRPIIIATTFRMANRWPVSGKRRMGGLVILDILSQAQLAGMHPINLQWLKPPCLRWTVSTLDMRLVEENIQLAHRTARVARLHRRLERWFPTTPPKSFDPRDHADMIIKRF